MDLLLDNGVLINFSRYSFDIVAPAHKGITDAEIKVISFEYQELTNVLQALAWRRLECSRDALPTAKNFFLVLIPGPFIFIFSPPNPLAAF